VTATEPAIPMLPYSLVVGQRELRTALEIGFVDPSVGVLASGLRGTAKSTTIRSFALMAYGALPVTLPLGATEDRVLGGWSIDALLDSRPEWQHGLIKQASDSPSRMLYVDEVNLLDDHLVNLVLDAASTNVLSVHRDNADRPPEAVRFALVGTMNPDEGWLRPQLLDRFGLVVSDADEITVEHRRQVLESVLRFEEERDDPASPLMSTARAQDEDVRRGLEKARARHRDVRVVPAAIDASARLADAFRVEGHRGEVTLLRAARAAAALAGAAEVEPGHLRSVAKPALIHRRPQTESGVLSPWDDTDDARVAQALGAA
jgi:magnesium chelatase subunit I